MWSPIPLDELLALIQQSELEMTASERRLWELVRVPPAKWALPPWGDAGGGFWVVGAVGLHVIWYNDIEHGFEVSRYSEPGTIRNYLCNQGGLQPVLYDLPQLIEAGEPPGGIGSPQPLG